MEDIHDVLIIGAGPVGLVLGLILAEHKIPFRIIDKREQWSEASKALTITPKTLEALGLIGIAHRFAEEGIKSRFITFHTHKRKIISRLDFSSVPSPYPFILQLPQNTTIATLAEALAGYGISAERSLQLESAEDTGRGYNNCTLYDTGTKSKCLVKARYVIGCDGAGSAVRGIMGENFAGSNASEAFVMADIKLTGHPFSCERSMFYLKKKSSLYVMPMNRHYYRLVSTTQKPVSEIDNAFVLEFFQKIFKDLGFDAIVLSEPLWISTFNPRQSIAENYIKGSLILAGDAAHIQSPVGSQGLNTGIQDAVNLGWKLALVLKSVAGKEMLASYHSERRPVALKLFSYNDQLNKSVFGNNRLSREWAICKRYLLNLAYFQNKEKTIVSQLHIRYNSHHLLKYSLPGKVPGRLVTRQTGLRPGHRFPSFKINTKDRELEVYSLLGIKTCTLFVFTENSGSFPVHLLNRSGEKYRIVMLEYSAKKEFAENPLPDLYYLQGRRFILKKKHFLCLVRPDSYIDQVAVL